MYLDGQIIINEGDPGDLFYLIHNGSVSCSQRGEELRTMTRGEFFGEQALLYNMPRTATVTAVGSVKLLSLSREMLH